LLEPGGLRSWKPAIVPCSQRALCAHRAARLQNVCRQLRQLTVLIGKNFGVLKNIHFGAFQTKCWCRASGFFVLVIATPQTDKCTPHLGAGMANQKSARAKGFAFIPLGAGDVRRPQIADLSTLQQFTRRIKFLIRKAKSFLDFVAVFPDLNWQINFVNDWTYFKVVCWPGYLAKVCASMPGVGIQPPKSPPSHAARERGNSYVKSKWPGVSL